MTRRPVRDRERKPPMTALQRKYQDAGSALPPAGLPVADCTCGAHYLDTDGGRDAHEIVFGHRPRPQLHEGETTP